MIVVALDRSEARPLIGQIVDAIRGHIDQRTILPGARLPSIRQFAALHNVSRATVVEAYDRLVALGQVEARRGAGFFIASAPQRRRQTAPANPRKGNEELVWLIRRLLEAKEGAVLAGGPWLPNSWMDEMGIRQSLAALARKNGSHLIEYGNPFGYLPLREHLTFMLAELGIVAQPSQIVLTQGTSQALDLIVRKYVKAGDGVLVDDPGYYNLFGNLRLQGANLLAVPRLADGPDLAALERFAKAHRPRIYFTQSVLQNPTGTGISAHAAFRILQLAEQYDFTIVEDDIFCDLQTRQSTRLATLDRLNRVIYARSFSKTLSGSLRVGFLAARQPLADELADIKMLSAITTSQVIERILYALLVDGHYRKFLTRLNQRIGDASSNTVHAFRQIGLDLFAEPDAGMFVWARFPGVKDAMALTDSAASNGIVLAPGCVFRPHLDVSPWMRFNVTTCEDPRVFRWLQSVSRKHGGYGEAAAE